MNTTDSDSADMRPEYDFSDARRGRYSGRFYVDLDTPVGQLVVLRRDLPEVALREGDVGRIALVDAASGQLEVEFGIGAEPDSARMSLRPGDLRLQRDDEVLHVRSRQTG